MNARRTTTGLGALMLTTALASAVAQGLRPLPVWSQAVEPDPAAAASGGAPSALEASGTGIASPPVGSMSSPLRGRAT